MEHLHPGARWQFRIGFYFLFIFLIIFLGMFSIASLSAIFEGKSIGYIFLIVFLLGIILIVILGEVFARLAYNNWKFEFTKTELKIERGIIFKTYKSIPYQRVQNVDIHRGILARMLGFSTLAIQTAGYSGYPQRGGRGLAEGNIPAVDISKAEKLREFVMKKIRGSSGGL